MNRTLAVTFSAILAAWMIPAASHAQLADSRTDFSGTQGQDGWFYGYRSYTLDGGGDNYDPVISFFPFSGGEGLGPWDGFSQIWDETTSQWDLNTAAEGPWTVIGEESVHPNGDNSFPFEEQWVIRRWEVSGLSGETVLSVVWHTRKQAAGGNGVTAGIWLDGTRIASAAIAGSDTIGVTRTNYVTVQNGDFIDLVLAPVGPGGDRADSSDGAFHWMVIDIPEDSDGDGLPDPWELLYADSLETLSGSGDADSDSLTDAQELSLGTSPINPDTDGDGLKDGVETNTGIYVGENDTGTDPLNPDTDGDGRLDGDEVLGNPRTDVFNPDSDDDTYPDGIEVATGHDPNDPDDTLVSSLIANSVAEFSGVQGQDNWYYGYRNFSADGGAPDYDPEEDFIPFPGGDGFGDWDGETQVWTGSQWDLNTAAAAPWTELGPENTHPNGPSPVHWVIRRWEASELTEVTPLALRYHVRKSNVNGGNGVTAGLYIDGRHVDSVTIPFNDGTGVIRTFFANVSPTNIIDLILSPRGTDGGDADGSDGSAFYLHIDPVLPASPRQPNGDIFVPIGSGDSDEDGLPDVWEESYFPGDLTVLSGDGDYDGDGLSDAGEFERNSDPTNPDTDGDGLPDVVETNTGVFVSATDTGTDPRNPDTDGDTLSDSEEVNGSPSTDPTKADTDGDGYLDPVELADRTDPNDPEDNLAVYLLAHSIQEFSGVQGQNGWYNGYRNYTLDGGEMNYDPETQFIPFPGGVDDGTWDGFSQTWTGSQWDLETAAAGPWTAQGPENLHPNGENSFPNEEHWAIRRWVADELTAETPVTIVWQVRKTDPNGGGVGGRLFINGELADFIVIGGSNTTNPPRRHVVTLSPGDIVDLAVTPENEDGTRTDSSDGSASWFLVDTRVDDEPPQGITITGSAWNAGQFTLTWESQPGETYTVEASEDLRTWTGVVTGHPSGGDSTSYSDTPPAGATARFYRILQE